MTHKDQRYIRALKEGNIELIESLYTANAKVIKNWILKNNGSIEDAKDVFQEVIETLLRISQDANFQLTCPIGALIFTIARNKWFDRLKALKKETELKNQIVNTNSYIELDNPIIEKIQEEEIRQTRLEKALSQLSDTCQKLLQLLGENKNTKEIIELMGMEKAATMYRRKKACIDRWRVLYQEIAVS